MTETQGWVLITLGIIISCVLMAELGFISWKLYVTNELIAQSNAGVLGFQDEIEGLMQHLAKYPYCPEDDPYGILTNIRCLPIPSSEETPSMVY